MTRVRSAAVFALLVPVALAGACSTDRTLYPPAGSLTLRIVDGGLGEQTSATPTLQAVRWTLDEASIDVQGYGEYGILGRVPCYATNNVLASTTLTTQCGGSPLSLTASGTREATVRIAFSEMELRRAWRPELPAGGDYDGDGVPNETDNCPIVPNPDQELATDSEHGVACGVIDPTTGSAADADTDADSVADTLDDCVWVADVDQVDSNGDGIGDACVRTTRVILDTVPFRLELPVAAFSLRSADVVTLVVDFDDTKSLVDCDPGMNVCRLDDSKITVSVR